MQGGCLQCICPLRNVPLLCICGPPPGRACSPAQSPGKSPWSMGPRGAARIGPPSLPGAAGGGVCVWRWWWGSGTTGKPGQKALPRRLPRHKKPDSSRGPDPFQIYIPLPATPAQASGCAASSEAGPRPAPRVIVAGVRGPPISIASSSSPTRKL